MAFRSRPISVKPASMKIVNQENADLNVKSMLEGLPSRPTRRPALGEISNKVNTTRGTELTNKAKQLTKAVKKPVAKSVATKPAEKVTVKLPVLVVKPLIKEEVKVEIKDKPEVQEHKEPDAFSSDLLPVEDIDEIDKGNPNLVSIYSNDIYAYLRELEKKYPICKGFLSHQEVTPKMRRVLVNWMVEVHEQFQLLQETLYLTVAVVDRFLQKFRTITRKRLQLVGITAMFIASKYEEMYPPDIRDFVYIADNAYTKAEILQMEMLIVKELDFSFGRPLPLHFLRRYSKAGNAHPVHHNMAKYFLEECLIHYEMCHFPPSLLAAAAIYLSFYVIGKTDDDDDASGKLIWTNTLAYYSTYTKEEVMPVVRDIASIVVNTDNTKYEAVKVKYTHSKYMKISLRSELKSPSMLALASIDKSQ